jgi:hypothetical protein
MRAPICTTTSTRAGSAAGVKPAFSSARAAALSKSALRCALAFCDGRRSNA